MSSGPVSKCMHCLRTYGRDAFLALERVGAMELDPGVALVLANCSCVTASGGKGTFSMPLPGSVAIIGGKSFYVPDEKI